MKKYYTIDEVVARASTFIPDLMEREALVARTWVEMAMRDLRYHPRVITTETLDFDTDLRGWVIPEDSLKVIEFYILDEQGNVCNTKILKDGEEIRPAIATVSPLLTNT